MIRRSLNADIVLHVQGKVLKRAVSIIKCVTFHKWTSLKERMCFHRSGSKFCTIRAASCGWKTLISISVDFTQIGAFFVTHERNCE